MSSPISEFYEPVRAFLGDFDAAVRRYADASILSVIQALIRGGQLNYATGAPYALTVDQLSIDPAVEDPNAWMLLVYRACSVFAHAGAGKESFKARALSRSTDGNPQLLWKIESELYKLENGTAFVSWQSFSDWAEGVTGLSIWHNLVELKVSAPVWSVSLGNGIA